MDEQNEAATLVREIATSLGGLAEEIQQLQTQLESAKLSLNQSAQNNSERLGQLESTLAELTGEIEGSIQETIDTVTSLSDVNDAIEELLAAASEDASPLAEATDNTIDELHQCAESTKDFIDTFINHQHEELERAILSRGTELREVLADAMAARIRELQEEVTRSISQRANSSLLPVADQIVSLVEGMIERFIKEIAEGETKANAENASLRPVMVTLRAAIDPLIQQFHRVESLNPL